MIHPIRRILVPLDPSNYTDTTTIHACRLAKAHNAKVSGLSVFDAKEIESNVVASMPSNWSFTEACLDLSRSHAHQELDVEEKKFRERCEQERVDYTETEMEGIPSNLILEAATLFDLVIMGTRTFYHFETRKSDGNELSKVLGRTSTPILAVPQGTGPSMNAVIAFDGSPASSRAVKDFIDFAGPLDIKVDLLTCAEDSSHAEFLLNRLEGYLTDHSFHINRKVQLKGKILDHVDKGAFEPYDLVVCGIHSRNIMKEAFVGSFTKRLIKDEKHCLFLSH